MIMYGKSPPNHHLVEYIVGDHFLGFAFLVILYGLHYGIHHHQVYHISLAANVRADSYLHGRLILLLFYGKWYVM